MQLLGICFGVIRQLSSSRLAVVSQSSGSRQPIARKSLGNGQYIGHFSGTFGTVNAAVVSLTPHHIGAALQTKSLFSPAFLMGLGSTYLFVFTSFFYAFDEDVKVVDDFVDPALVVPLLDSLVTQFGHDANTATNHGSLQREEDIMSSENLGYTAFTTK